MSEVRWCDVANHPFPLPNKGCVRMQVRYQDENDTPKVRDMDACGDHAALFLTGSSLSAIEEQTP